MSAQRPIQEESETRYMGKIKTYRTLKFLLLFLSLLYTLYHNKNHYRGFYFLKYTVLAPSYFVTVKVLLTLLATPPQRLRASALAKLEFTSFSPSDYHRQGLTPNEKFHYSVLATAYFRLKRLSSAL